MAMNLLFFQNIVSPHQMPYIERLPEMEGVGDVVVIVPEAGIDERSALGWDVKKWLQTEGIRFVVSPWPDDVEGLIDSYSNRDTWCLFSGINAFPEVATWFRASLKYKVKRSVITEPPYVYGHPLWQHAIRFALRDWRYVKFIDKIFVMGDEYLNYYRFWSKRWEVISFMYCTEWRVRETEPNTSGDKLRVLYVGSLSHRKNVQCLLKAAMLLSEEEQEQLEIGIVGDGDEREKLEFLTEGSTTTVKFYGTQPMEKISVIMERYDVLVLPSLHDGWGAVVNEALTLGLYVICSDHCGAKMLLKSTDNGLIFKSDNDRNLALKIRKCIQERDKIREGTKERIVWSREHIAGKAVASYFLSKLK